MVDIQIEDVLLRQLQGLVPLGIELDCVDSEMKTLSQIGFFRISQIAYQIHEKDPKRHTKLSEIIKIFHYEQALRTLLSESISYLEVELRSLFSSAYSEWYGPHGYRDRENFSEHPQQHGELIAKLKKQLRLKSLYEVVDDKKIDELHINQLPVWLAMELSTFHMLTLFFEILTDEKKAAIAQRFGESALFFSSWIDYLLVVRNACAHQGMLFNRKFNRIPLTEENRDASVGTAFYILKKLLVNRNYFNSMLELQDIHLDDELKWVNKYFGLV